MHRQSEGERWMGEKAPYVGSWARALWKGGICYVYVHPCCPQSCWVHFHVKLFAGAIDILWLSPSAAINETVKQNSPGRKHKYWKYQNVWNRQWRNNFFFFKLVSDHNRGLVAQTRGLLYRVWSVLIFLSCKGPFQPQSQELNSGTKSGPKSSFGACMFALPLHLKKAWRLD